MRISQACCSRRKHAAGETPGVRSSTWRVPWRGARRSAGCLIALGFLSSICCLAHAHQPCARPLLHAWWGLSVPLVLRGGGSDNTGGATGAAAALDKVSSEQFEVVHEQLKHERQRRRVGRPRGKQTPRTSSRQSPRLQQAAHAAARTPGVERTTPHMVAPFPPSISLLVPVSN